MELAFLVYGIDLLIKISTFSKGFLIIMAIVTGTLVFIGLVISPYDDDLELFKKYFKEYYPLKLTIFIGFLFFLIPNQQTMKYIGGAYLLQSTFESEFVQETATLSQKAIIKQLKVWAEDTPEVATLLKDIGVEVSNIKENIEEKALQEMEEVLKSSSKQK